MRKCHRIAAMVSIMATAIGTGAGAQDVIRSDCLAHVAPASRLSFAHEKHRLWYQRYWNGKCQGLTTSIFGDNCSESEPGWNQVVSNLVKEARAERASEVLMKSCKLGELVGYEWAKDNNVRCIHSMGGSSLSTLKSTLSASGDILDRLAKTEARARSMCANLRPPPRK